MAQILDLEIRKNLVLSMLSDVLNVVEKITSAKTYLISADKQVKALSSKFHFTFIDEFVEEGLNHAISIVINALSQNNEDSLLILPADIPLIEPEDIASILQWNDKFDLVICRSKDGAGTNALLLKPTYNIQPMFGENSFQKHLMEASEKRLKVKILDINRIAFDIDSIDDLIKLTQFNNLKNTTRFILENRILNRITDIRMLTEK